MNATLQGTRCPWHDYRQPWYYMVTMTTFERKPIFATCRDGKITPTQDGWLMYNKWREISQAFPQVETSTFVIMPDHIHGIVHVKERMEKPLGVPLRTFKSQVTGALRERHQDPALSVWTPGYHDWRVLRKGALKAFAEYIRDNPRRYNLKKAHPDLFVRVAALAHPRLPQDVQWSAYGNRFLLDRPFIAPLRVSRRATPGDLRAIAEGVLGEIAGGAVVISPFISQGEKDIATLILGMEHGDVILMNPNGFGPCFRPRGKYFDLCAQGRLLILSAFPYTAQEAPLTREVCERMNGWCREISGVNT